ncbi:hypothetical protein I3843_02G154400 [Carya illinoinensis]|uniref:Class IV aminotransferase n=1 Tax=Carya illinoinensis TaxID=32201 RepID=A0A922FZ06_CARIL|nr:hypothetical protein I3760_02G176300 [Carya illinoinensis]KAG6728471.1 hypothetical protein I3842_02G174400 [Carya illinoinensis]KAG7992975.1 hypothetical protein I3843_02G154400 [Carya illinoinensis]
MSSSRFLFRNGTVLHSSDAAAPITTFLESHPGAYTTTRTHHTASCLLFWERHVNRLADSIRILSNSAPKLLFQSNNHRLSLPVTSPMWESAVRALVDDSMNEALPIAMNERSGGEELSVTVLVCGSSGRFNGFEYVDEELMREALDVYVSVGCYVPRAFDVRGNGARLAVVGQGRDVANAKYSDWVRLRKPLEKLRPPSVTELLLSNDGDHILEGCVTNFFVVCRKDNDEAKGTCLHDQNNTCAFEVQTAPIQDGVLPGIIRQIVMEVCLSKGISFREVAPSWSKHEIWEEAFITSSLRLLEHVETIQVPSSWKSLNSKTWEEISWEQKQFEQEGPGMITRVIQKGIMEKANLEGFPIGDAV